MDSDQELRVSDQGQGRSIAKGFRTRAKGFRSSAKGFSQIRAKGQGVGVVG